MLVTILERLKQICTDLTFEAISEDDDKENYFNVNRQTPSSAEDSGVNSLYFKKVLKFE